MKNKKLLTFLAITAVTLGMPLSSHAVHFYDTQDTVYEASVERLADLDVISGVSSNTFNAEKSVTRAEFAKMFVNTALNYDEKWAYVQDDAEVNFSDIDKGSWYYEYVVRAVNGQYMKGFEDGTFRPDAEVTYEQIAKLTTLALGHTYLVDTNPNGWSYEYVNKAYEIGLFADCKFNDIKDGATRGNVAIILWNTLKKDIWKMYERNDTTGFTYTSTGVRLFEKNHPAYVLLENAKINAVKEFNGELYVKFGNGFYYKLHDQKATFNFSMIGGTTDVIFVRTLQPDLTERLEIVGLTPDAGYRLYSGTLDELKEDGFTIENSSKLSAKPNYAYLYHNKDKEDTRTITLNTSKFYLIDKIDIKDENEKEEKEFDPDNTKKKYEDRKTSDEIGFVYTAKDKIFERTITINESEVLPNGAVLFMDNKRVDWKNVKENDVVTCINEDTGYYILTKDKYIDITLKEIDQTKDNYSITSSANDIYTTYKDTKLKKYNKETLYNLNTMKEADYKDVLGKRVRLYRDFVDGVIKLQVIETEKKSTMKSANVGFFIEYLYGATDNNSNRIRVLVNGEKKVYILNKDPNLQIGDLVSWEYANEKNEKEIKSIKKITGNTDLSDTIKLQKMPYATLKNSIKSYENKDIQIVFAKYKYAFGKYDVLEDFEVENITIEEFLTLRKPDDLTIYSTLDKYDNYDLVIIQDYTNKTDMYYGLITKIFTEDKAQKITVDVLGGQKMTFDTKKSAIEQYKAGDYISFKIPRENNLDIMEKYTTSVMGFKKDIRVLGKEFVTDKYGKDTKEVKLYNLQDDGILDMKDWTITTKDGKEYDLDYYTFVLLDVGKKENGDYYFKSSKLFTEDNIDLKKNDMLAIDEIEDLIVVYRGYDETK